MKKGTILTVIGLVLIAAALSIAGYNIWDMRRAEDVTESVLKELVPQIKEDPIPVTGRISRKYAEAVQIDETGEVVTDEIEYPDYVLDPTIEMPTLAVDSNDYIGILSIPALKLTFPVLSEWSYPNLRISPCRYIGSVYLNNLVIAAHNYERHFGNLNKLSMGDAVTFTDMDGNVFDFEVTEIVTLAPTMVDEMAAGEWDLTLFTCTLGGKSRVTVRCEKIED